MTINRILDNLAEIYLKRQQFSSSFSDVVKLVTSDDNFDDVDPLIDLIGLACRCIDVDADRTFHNVHEVILELDTFDDRISRPCDACRKMCWEYPAFWKATRFAPNVPSRSSRRLARQRNTSQESSMKGKANLSIWDLAANHPSYKRNMIIMDPEGTTMLAC